MKNAITMLHSVVDTICNSFLITTEDGKLIAVDGGYEKETEHFLEVLKATAGSEKPHVDAWFLTHAHDDHVNCFFDILENHPDALTVGKVYLNFPSKGFFEGSDASAAQTMEDFYRVLPKFADKMRILCGGDTLEVGAAKFRVFYSQDFEIRANCCNNSSLVFRMDLGGKSVLFTGDCGVEAGEKVLRLWGDSGLLDCDIVQMAHHGQNGVSKAFYEAVKPEICLWPTPSWLWTNCDGTGPYRTLEVRGWMEELGVRENYVNMNGTQVISLE